MIPVVSGTYAQLLSAGMSREAIKGQFVETFAGEGGHVLTSEQVATFAAGGYPDIPNGGSAMNGAVGAVSGIPYMPVGYNGMATAVGPTHADVVPGILGTIGDVPVSGPGVPEPPRQMVAKQWSVAVHSNTYGTFRIFFFRLLDGRIMMYNPSVKGWKIWRPKKPIVLYRGRITLSQAVKAQKLLDKLWRTAAKKTKAIKMA